MNDESKKVLESAARLADEVARQHKPTCGAAVLMRAVAETARAALAAGSGPAQVATPAYRQNYETLFGKKQTVGQA